MTSRSKKNNNWQEAYSAIERLILSSQLKPGEKITEIGMTAKLGIGRTPVREAMKKLEQEGLIITEKNRKCVYLLTIKEADEIFDIKISLESAVCAWAAKRGTENSYKNLKKILEDMQDLVAVRPSDEEQEKVWFKKWIEKDEALHKLIFQMAGNHRAEAYISNLNKQWHQLRIGLMAMEDRIDKSIEEHEKIVEAIIKRDSKAAEEAMIKHLSNLRKVLTQILKIFNYPVV